MKLSAVTAAPRLQPAHLRPFTHSPQSYTSVNPTFAGKPAGDVGEASPAQLMSQIATAFRDGNSPMLKRLNWDPAKHNYISIVFPTSWRGPHSVVSMEAWHQPAKDSKNKGDTEFTLALNGYGESFGQTTYQLLSTVTIPNKGSIQPQEPAFEELQEIRRAAGQQKVIDMDATLQQRYLQQAANALSTPDIGDYNAFPPEFKANLPQITRPTST